MIIRKSYKFRLQPNRSHLQNFKQFSGCCRFVWNKALALQKEQLQQKEKVFRYAELAKLLKEWKASEETQFLKDCHSQPLQQVLKDLDRSLWDGLKQNKGMPHFKKKGVKESFRYPQGVKLEGSKVFLPKVGWVKFRRSRSIEGSLKNATVTQKVDHWFVSLQCEIEMETPSHPSETKIGIDLGIARLATLSDGQFFHPIHSFRVLEKKLAKSQRLLSKKVKFSSNWKKQKKKVNQIHSKISFVRQDYLHKISTQLSQNHATIVIEDLKISNMSKSAKGTIEQPGKQVRAKSGLNKSILDQGWYELRRQLEYKQLWLGGEVIAVPAKNTSRRCPQCQHTHHDNRKSQSKFVCLKCGFKGNADHVAAINILAVGTTVSACGELKIA